MTDAWGSVVREKLRRLRKEKNLTLQKMEDEYGIAKNVLSRIERGKAPPQLETYGRLAEIYGISRIALMDTTFKEGEDYQKKNEDKLLKERPIINIENIQYYVDAHLNDGKILASIMVIKEGENKKFAKHKIGSEELLYVMEGELTVTVREKKIQMKKGDIILYSGSEPHNFNNSKKEDAIIFAVNANSGYASLKDLIYSQHN